MRLQVEHHPTIENPSEKEVRSAISALRSYGPSSFASVTDETGSFLQVGGGGVTCLLERRDAATGQHFRGHHEKSSKVFPDGTILAFGANKIRMAANEWFDQTMVAEAFAAFVRGEQLPTSIKWREVTDVLSAPGTREN